MTGHLPWMIGWAVLGGLAGTITAARIPRWMTRRPPPPRLPTIAATSMLFAALASRIHSLPELLAPSWLATIGVPLAVIDICERRLPNKLTVPSYPILVALIGLTTATTGHGEPLLRALACLGITVASHLALAVASHGGLGAGDVKLSGLSGLVLGWYSWTAVVAGIVFGLVLASLACAMLSVAGRTSARTHLAYGPWILLGTFTALMLTPAPG